MRAMSLDDTVLYEQFVAARLRAVELTDTYRQTAPDDPRRPIIWEHVVDQTEVARRLLECWLSTPTAQRTANTASLLR